VLLAELPVRIIPIFASNPDAPGMESVTSTILSAQASSPPPAPMAVLIIESDPLVRDALELHFRQHPSIGIVVVDAVDGAFTQLEQLRFDAVILDASIPRAEEVIFHLEQKHPAPAVLLTISLADAANLEHFPRSAGLLALTKPTPLVILERGIELAIAYRRTLERNKSLEHTYHEQSIKLEQLHHECDTLRQQLARLHQRFRFAIHDLQNPLSNLMALLGDLQRHTTNLPPRVSESLELSYQSTQLLQTYIEDMLNALQLDSTETITFGPVDVAHLVRNVARRFTPNADRKNIWINVLAPPTLPVIYADESLLSKALDNLVSNAIKFTPQGGAVTIEVEVSRDVLLIRVRDTGLGMTRDDLAHAFEEFRRLSATPTGSEPSTGLGLWIVRRIAELHRGRVWAESPGKGSGSVFTFELPLHQENHNGHS